MVRHQDTNPKENQRSVVQGSQGEKNRIGVGMLGEQGGNRR